MIELDQKIDSNLHLELAMETAVFDFWEFDLRNGNVKLSTTKILAELGYEENETDTIISDFISYVHPDDIIKVKKALLNHLNQKTPQFRSEFRIKSKSDTWIWYANYGKLINQTETQPGYLLIGTTVNIEEKKQKEIERNLLIRTLKLVSECSTMLIQANDEQELIDGICRVAVQTGDYVMAWIGYAEHDAAKSVSVRSHFGFDEGYISNLNITWADTPLGRGPVGTAIRNNETIVNQDFQHNPAMIPWRDAAIKHGFHSNIALPLLIQNQVIGVFNIYASEPFAFSYLEVVLLEELASTVSYGIEFLRTRAQKDLTQIELKKENEKNLALLHNASDGIHILDENGNIIEASNSFCSMLGYSREEMLGMHVSQWDSLFSKKEIQQNIKKQLHQNNRIQFESQHLRKDRSTLFVEVSGHSLVLNEKPVIFNSSRDITERKKIEAILHEKQKQLVESETHYRELVNNLHTAIVVHNPDTSIKFSNPRASDLLCLSKEQLLGKEAIDPAWCFLDEQYLPLPIENYPVSQVIRNRQSIDALVLGVQVPDGSRIIWVLVNAFPEFNSDGSLKQVVVHFDDISERKQADEKIYHLAFYDDLTGLPNRRLLMDRLRSALSNSARSNKYGAVLFIDMDRFKTINDVLGHDVGDLMLIEIANRIHGSVRKVDTVARLGGDEFIVLVTDIDENIQSTSIIIEKIAEKIRATLAAPFYLNDTEQHSSPSIGISLFLGENESPETLLRQSDMAMYKAKDAGRNSFRFFNPEMQFVVETRAVLEADLRHAVPDNQLRILYQLQVDNNLSPIGAEALVRWVHPTRGLVSPLQFIPIAEESSLILDIGDWVLRAACQQLVLWNQSKKLQHLTIAVNVSAQQFRQSDFVSMIKEVLRHYQIQPSKLKLELTESVVLSDVNDVVNKMHALKKLGVQLSMDDFGTGYSSLSYLKQLPLDQLKIDQSFVRDIISDPNDAVMVKTIIDLANNFRLQVIAEGVEDYAQLDFLKLHGCDAYQGYLFSKPISSEEFDHLLHHSH